MESVTATEKVVSFPFAKHVYEVRPPSPEHTLSEFTEEGRSYKQECRDLKQAPQFEPGRHYIVVAEANRMLLPELKQLGKLRHRWVWQRRPRPCVPVWNSSKLPRSSYSPEENARLMSVYMRPWTLDPQMITPFVPLLANLGDYIADHPSSKVSVAKSEGLVAKPSPSKRLRSKTSDPSIPDVTRLRMKSYARAWSFYVNGNIVTEASHRYITNLISATAARFVEHEDSASDSSGDSASEDDRFGEKAGSLELVQKTLLGVAARDVDEGCLGSGRHAASVCLGKELWGSPELTEKDKRSCLEPHFGKEKFPPAKDALKAIASAFQDSNRRHQGACCPHSIPI